LHAAVRLKPREGRRVIGLVTDIGFPNGRASTIALFDGSASLYLSNGGGVIGAGFHEPVRSKTFEAIDLAETFLDAASPADSSPLPGANVVRFNFVTSTGVSAVEVPIKDLFNPDHRLSPLFHVVNDVITGIRLQSGDNLKKWPPHDDAQDFKRPDGARFESAAGEPLNCAPTDSYAAVSDVQVVRTGLLTRQASVNNAESRMAGTSDYFVLVCDGASPAGDGHRERLILRPTRAIPFSSIGNFTDRRVEIRGREAARLVLAPTSSITDGPSSASGAERRGGGLLVDNIEVLEETWPPTP
jgi:hypothetical protein